ncbi:MAG: hypothetical protein FQY80_05465, partial [Ornithobacterium rhinotracheale]|nr:hypothetical protein [Ornithobacterium rhinotracheale]
SYIVKNGERIYFEDSIHYKCPPIFDKMRLIDVNFDGTKDLVIPREECAFAYVVTPSPYIYVATKSGKLIYSEELSGLGGEVYIDPVSKRIFAYDRYSAAGWYWSIYKVVPKKGLVLLDEFMDAGFLHDDDPEPIVKELKYKEMELPKTAILLNSNE